MPDPEKVPPADPLAYVRDGDPAGASVLEGIAASVAAGRQTTCCKARDPLGIGLLCTRPTGHPGQHIADAEREVAGTWPAGVVAA